MKVQPIYTNKFVKKGLEFAADNGTLFIGTASLALSTIARPLSILATPKTDRENKRYACMKSIASTAIGYFMMFGVSMPFAKAMCNIDENPTKYLNKKTVKTLQRGEKTLQNASRYRFVSQLFKLGLGLLIAVPKSALTCALIPPLMKKIFPKKEEDKKQKNITFTGMEPLSKGIGKIIDTKPIQHLAEKFHNTNFEFNIMSLTDIVATGAFIRQVAKSKKIEQDRKKALMYNSAISTALCVVAGYTIDKMSKKSTENFIKKFSEANKNSPKLGKYIQGIKIVKPAMIFGAIYYIAIPIISTFLADRFDGKNYKKS